MASATAGKLKFRRFPENSLRFDDLCANYGSFINTRDGRLLGGTALFLGVIEKIDGRFDGFSAGSFSKARRWMMATMAGIMTNTKTVVCTKFSISSFPERASPFQPPHHNHIKEC
ncbi:hypothetical protein TcasGA2_TC002755 [Tribolium castaneum]|uniref:Uncharacterized protein n=1 Tax=Tribolium castaneum TaxID=7070 RepID=D6WDL0_TRICA|nr:hypothetical protein TcasGA2_TC002755 [Tribolium castaneum]